MWTFPGITHVAVTVTDLSVSVPWYEQLFGADAVLDEDTGPFRHVVFAIGGGMLFGLHAFPDVDGFTEFAPRRRGLDHVAFACPDRADLERWQSRLEELGIRHGGIVDAHYGSGLSFKDPDGIALEFFAPPAQKRVHAAVTSPAGWRVHQEPATRRTMRAAVFSNPGPAGDVLRIVELDVSAARASEGRGRVAGKVLVNVPGGQNR